MKIIIVLIILVLFLLFRMLDNINTTLFLNQKILENIRDGIKGRNDRL